jgi:hypothetical protein
LRAALIAAIPATLLLGACGQQRSGELAQSEHLLILEEIGIEGSLIGYESEPVDHETTSYGPTLVAGDWLAIQCAQAAGYFDGNDWAPVYANVVSYDFE